MQLQPGAFLHSGVPFASLVGCCLPIEWSVNEVQDVKKCISDVL